MHGKFSSKFPEKSGNCLVKRLSLEKLMKLWKLKFELSITIWFSSGNWLISPMLGSSSRKDIEGSKLCKFDVKSAMELGIMNLLGQLNVCFVNQLETASHLYIEEEYNVEFG